ncbi:DUF4838 domain-containing protein [Flavihumibacter fluvii]|uniref:DUF4838 domain-containing protein n=1 Tax=Flavihumibacter fluvii TaxID=2838157 RepID=UPI001BDE0FB5|nr:DUF4838 domain-containing protein [Flavihumibacter fluvii]ULQ51922.1 DUF4838 domain-containing protein [Flavihumibacter fluvii]
MKKLLLFMVAGMQYFVSPAQKIDLVKNGQSAYSIVVPAKPTTMEVKAAKVLQDYLRRMTGKEMPLRPDDQQQQEQEILIGNVQRATMQQLPVSELPEDGLWIKTSGKKLLITGGTRKGVLYGVYTFLEKYLGCRKYASDLTVVPKRTSITLNAINDRQLPAFTYREVFYNDAYNQEYMDWHKLHSFEGRGADKSQWGYWVHTFASLLDIKEYGATHPEYFAYYDGQRHAGAIPTWDGKGLQPEAQLCLSNKDVLDIVCKNLKEAMDKKPGALYWSVSQNDNVNHCKCAACAALDSTYAAFRPEDKMYSTHGGEKYPALGMGSLLHFVNQVADRFPDKIISTLAYQYTRVPPRGIVPRKNVNIMLCSIESSRNDPMETGDTSFSSDLKGWGRITNNILIWDYTISFNNLLAPFPNLRVLQPNIQFLHRNHVSALFEQGNIQQGGEFAQLRAYLMARMLWNPELSVEKEMDEFLAAYYGPAASDVKAYITLLHDNNQSGKGVKMSIFGSPVDGKESYLSQPLINRYNAIFDRAEAAVKQDETLFARVRSARLPVYYATLEIAREEKTGPRGAFVQGAKNAWIPNPSIAAALYEFYYHCMRTNVARIAEWDTTPTEYFEQYQAFLAAPPK